MQTSTIAPVRILRGRRPQDSEIVLRFDPASPIARTEVQVEDDEQLGADAATRLVLYREDFQAAMAADHGDQDDAALVAAVMAPSMH